jgi:RHH-type proline utilization regulon transcriptional repressor/proline dehydrogenase/delta 1-pyrroline-5-carboxylate dehydrogenase
VRRQPFGGMKRSAFGGGIKAGGPNYVSCFVEFTEKEIPAGKRLDLARESYQQAWQNEFSQAKDVSHIYGEENIFRYLPLKNAGFRVREKDDLTDILLVLMATDTTHTPLTVSVSNNHPLRKDIEKAASGLSNLKIKLQDEQAFIAEMDQYERIRTCSADLPEAFYRKAAELGKHIANAKPLIEGRLELLHYLKEQSISYEYHRYGSIFGEEK